MTTRSLRYRLPRVSTSVASRQAVLGTLILLMSGCSPASGPAAKPQSPASEADRVGRETKALAQAIEEADIGAAVVAIRRGADVNKRDSRGSTPLYYSASKAVLLPVDEALIAAGADVNARCICRSTPLFNACEWGGPRVAEFLVRHSGKIDVADKDGVTPLDAAVSGRAQDRIQLVSFLLAHGADVNAKDHQGRTPLDWARDRPVLDATDEAEQAEVIGVLVTYGARSGRQAAELKVRGTEGDANRWN